MVWIPYDRISKSHGKLTGTSRRYITNKIKWEKVMTAPNFEKTQQIPTELEVLPANKFPPFHHSQFSTIFIVKYLFHDTQKFQKI